MSPAARTKPLHVVGAAIPSGPRCLVARRGPTMALAGQWKLPGGKVERGERPERALAREIREELELEIESHECLGRGEATGWTRRSSRRRRAR